MTEKSDSDDEVTRLRQQLSQMSDLLDAEKAKNRLPKNLDFVQISRSEMRAIADLGTKNPLALDLLMIFAQSMNKQNAVMISFRAMKQLTGKSRATLDRAIRVLKQNNWIQVVKVGQANAYVLNSAVFWSDRGDKRSMASFSAQVVTTFEEQEKDIRQCPDVSLKRVPSLEPKAQERVLLNDEELPPPDQGDLDLN